MHSVLAIRKVNINSCEVDSMRDGTIEVYISEDLSLRSGKHYGHCLVTLVHSKQRSVTVILDFECLITRRILHFWWLSGRCLSILTCEILTLAWYQFLKIKMQNIKCKFIVYVTEGKKNQVDNIDFVRQWPGFKWTLLFWDGTDVLKRHTYTMQERACNMCQQTID